MEILKNNNPILSQKSQPYTKEEIKSIENRQFVNDLFNTMIQHNGIGIAAVQVGVLKQVICVNIEEFSEIMFNPIILQKSRKCKMIEGCLSFPEKQINISRPSKITVKWLDRNAQIRFETLTGLAARVVLHEYDHLMGITFNSYEVE